MVDSSQTKSIGIVAIVNTMGAFIGVAQAFVVGKFFGTSSSIEIFFAASTIYVAVYGLLQSGQIAEIFTPVYHRIKESDGLQAAFDLQAVLLNWMGLITILGSVLLYAAAGFIIPLAVPGFSEQRTATCVLMFQYLVPLIALQILQFLLANLLINEKHFVARELTRSLSNFVSLLTIVCLASILDAWAMIAGLWTTCLVNLAVYCILISRLGYRHHFRLRHGSFPMSDLIKKLPSIFVYVCVAQLYAVVLTAGLSTLPQGILAVFTYARRLFARVSGILVRPVSTVFFSNFSSAVAEADVDIQKISTGALRMILLLTTATCVLAITVGLPLLRMLWLSPVFPESQIWLTYLTFSALCFLPIFSGLGLIYRKMNMAHQYTHSQYAILTLNMLGTVILAYFLIPKWGLCAAVVVQMLNVIALAIASGGLLQRTHPERRTFYDEATLRQCGLMFVIAVTLPLLLQHGTNFFQWLPQSTLGHFAAAAILGVVSVALMAGAAHLMGISELRSCMNLVQRKFQRLRGSL